MYERTAVYHNELLISYFNIICTRTQTRIQTHMPISGLLVIKPYGFDEGGNQFSHGEVVGDVSITAVTP